MTLERLQEIYNLQVEETARIIQNGLMNIPKEVSDEKDIDFVKDNNIREDECKKYIVNQELYRCKILNEHYSCPTNSCCKACRMNFLSTINLTDDEYEELFDIKNIVKSKYKM